MYATAVTGLEIGTYMYNQIIIKMFFCPDNYEEFLKREQEWFKEMEIKHREHVLKTFPSLCGFFNLSTDFTEEELENAYKQMRLKYHPDRPHGDKEKFMRAFEVYNEIKSNYKYYKEISQR